MSQVSKSAKRNQRRVQLHQHLNAVEMLEPRVLLSSDVLINSTAYDHVNRITTDTQLGQGFAGQTAATNIVYDPAGSDTPTIVAGYQNAVMSQFVGSPGYYADSTSISTDGGSTFSTLSPDTHLPDGPGTSAYGDDGNATVARDPTTGKIYLATTSDTGSGHPDIQVFSSTDGGLSFSAPMNATPGLNSDQLDKPWIATDNNGTLWLTFVDNGTESIYLTSYSGTSWPSVGYGDTQWVAPSSGVTLQAPQVVFDNSNNPYVIYYKYTAATDTDPAKAEIDGSWYSSSDHAIDTQTLVTLNPNEADQNSVPDMYVSTGDGAPVRAEYFPSVAYDKATNQIYVAYADHDYWSGVPHAYVLAWNLTVNSVGSPQEVSIPGDTSEVGEAWNPSVAISPDGGSLFVGFYGLPDSSTDNVYVYDATGSISTGGVLTLNDTQTLSGPFQPANTPDSKTAIGLSYYYWGDNDSASADYDNFYYSHLETSPQTFDVSGTPTNYNESDVYLSTVPIPYSTRIPQPSGLGFSDSSGPVLSWGNATDYSTQQMYFEYSTPTQPWTQIPFTFEPYASSGSASLSSFSYNSSTTYYFRVRAGYSGSNSANGSSTYSKVLIVPASSTMLFNGTSGNDTMVLKKDGGNIDYTLNGVAQAPVSFNSSADLLVEGLGGTDSITLDLSGGNFLVASTTIDNHTATDIGSLALKIIGTTSGDTVSIVGVGTAPYIVGGKIVHVLAGAINSLEYDDGGGNDSIASYSAATTAPVTIGTGSGNDAIDLETSNSVTVNSASSGGGTETVSTGGSAEPNLTFNASSGTLKVAASAGFAIGNGIRHLPFTAITIASGANVVFANTSSTLGDYSNHANRTLAVVAAGGLNIASGGRLDVGDNSMLLKYLPANKAATDSMISSLLGSGYAGGAWSGNGIDSSEATYDAYYGASARAVGWADQNDVGNVSFEGDTADITDGNEIMIKFTYYGDTDLSGTVDSTDSANFSLGLHGFGDNGNAGWEFGDFDYSGGNPTASDSQSFSTGLAAYKTFGLL